MKSSYYNLTTTNMNGDYVLYNTRSGAIIYSNQTNEINNIKKT